MSSILRALRKLENAVSETERVHSLPIDMGSDRTKGRQNRRLKRLSGVLGGLVVLVLLFFSAAYLYGRNFILIQKILPTWGSYPSDKQTGESKPIQKPLAAKKPEEIVRPQQKTPPKERVARKTAAAPKASNNLPRQKPTPSAPNFPPVKRTRPTQTMPPRTAKVSSNATRFPRPNTSTPAPTLPIKSKTLNDDRFKVQAIAWSEDPQQRITVINGQILREGDTFEELTIAGIQQDAVIVRKGTDNMTIEFRIK
jgi:hypothetical protein